MNNAEDYYEILQVHHAAEPEVIEAAYRRLLRMYHPDVNKSAEAHDKTVQLNRAYETLRDPTKRAAYDRQRGSQAQSDYRREWGASGTAGNDDLLFAEIVRGNVYAVRSLISEGANVNARDENGLSPLHIAAEEGRTAIAQALISSGSNVNAKDSKNWTPLHYAGWGGHAEPVEALVSAGAEVNATDGESVTPLHLAAITYNANLEAVYALVSAGAEVNARDIEGKISLHNVVIGVALSLELEDSELGSILQSRFISIAAMLVSAGADVDASDIYGRTPLNLVPSPRDTGTSIRNELSWDTSYREDVAEYDRKQVQS